MSLSLTSTNRRPTRHRAQKGDAYNQLHCCCARATPERKTQAPIGPADWIVWVILSSRLRLGEQDQSGMLMGARPISRRLTHLSHHDSCPAAHGSHLTGNKVLNSRDLEGQKSQTGRQKHDRKRGRRQSKKESACP
ncbi:hypothetical protein ElyMa_001608600 [Elysia marginata]|uniref:Uncharacterized protein n=1 Tax=Elysia marginata TaxID=1093978 RepID=A0AAV4JH22_9GAST|nr:hypothetical protein ElyMa_001608600 [Elysia marginata]